MVLTARVAADTTKADGGSENLLPAADLKGWTRVPIPPTHPLGRAQWHLDAHRQVLVCDGDGGHEMLRFDRLLANGTFHVEFRFIPLPDPKADYNSGIFIRNSADGLIWHQCQLMMDGGYLFGATPDGNQKPKRFEAPASQKRMKTAGEWNTAELTAVDQVVTAVLNGVEVSKFTGCGNAAGYIALESEGYAVEFRNLKWMERK